MAESNRCFELFATAGPHMSTPKLNELCSAAWKEDANLCLSIVFWLGSLDSASEQRERFEQGDEKGSQRQRRFTFYRAMLWLFNCQPKTFLLNACLIPVHTSLTALLDILMFTLNQAGAIRWKYGLESLVPPRSDSGCEEDWRSWCSLAELQKEFQQFRRTVRGLVFGKLQLAHETATEVTGKTTAAFEMQHKQRFYDIVVGLFADGLAKELSLYKKHGGVGGSFAQQAPSPQRMHDKATKIVDGIAERLFRTAQREADGVKDRVLWRRRYQQEVLAELRARRSKELELAVRLRWEAARDTKFLAWRRQQREQARKEAERAAETARARQYSQFEDPLYEDEDMERTMMCEAACSAWGEGARRRRSTTVERKSWEDKRKRRGGGKRARGAGGEKREQRKRGKVSARTCS